MMIEHDTSTNAKEVAAEAARCLVDEQVSYQYVVLVRGLTPPLWPGHSHFFICFRSVGIFLQQHKVSMLHTRSNLPSSLRTGGGAGSVPSIIWLITAGSNRLQLRASSPVY